MIQGFFDPALAARGQPWPRVRAAVVLPGLAAKPMAGSFVLDTGAMRSCLHPVDAIYVGLTRGQLMTPQLWPRKVSSQGVGGSMEYFEAQAELAFLDGASSALIAVQTDIEVAPLRPETESLPSLLGWDVLREFRLALDWDRREVTLNPIAGGQWRRLSVPPRR